MGLGLRPRSPTRPPSGPHGSPRGPTGLPRAKNPAGGFRKYDPPAGSVRVPGGRVVNTQCIGCVALHALTASCGYQTQPTFGGLLQLVPCVAHAWFSQLAGTFPKTQNRLPALKTGFLAKTPVLPVEPCRSLKKHVYKRGTRDTLGSGSLTV